MKRDVMLTIRGLQGTAEDGSEIELVTVGRYEYDPDRTTLTYMETELTGLEGTLTEIVVEPNVVTITRTGAVAMQMVFREGEKCYFVYSTPAGNMTMGLDTQSIRKALGDGGGELEVRYMMDFGGSMVTRNSFFISVSPAEQRTN